MKYRFRLSAVYRSIMSLPSFPCYLYTDVDSLWVIGTSCASCVSEISLASVVIVTLIATEVAVSVHVSGDRPQQHYQAPTAYAIVKVPSVSEQLLHLASFACFSSDPR